MFALSIQGYCYAKDARTLSAWKSLISARAHVEKCKGTPEQNRDYCSKEEGREPGTEPFVWGVFPNQGHRTDLDGLYALIKEGTSERNILEADPGNYFKYSGGIKRALILHQARRDWKPTVLWWYGSTGSGKSREAAERFPDAYWKMGSSRWWDGYDGQSEVIVDDYRRDLCTFGELLRILDRYPLLIEYKGGTCQFLAKTIVITTPRSPRDTWTGRTDEDLAQLERRIDEVKLFGTELPPPAPFVSTFNKI